MFSLPGLISATSIFSILMNFFCIYVILKHSHFIGNYKYVLAGYCFHEALCAFIIATVCPVHFVYDNTYIIFSTGSLVEGTELGKYGSGVYCGLLLMWIAFTLFQFLYRYVVVCHDNLYRRIVRSCFLKALILLVAGSYAIYLLICGSFWCRMAEIPDTMRHELQVEFNISNISHHGYMLMRLVNNDGSISVFGTLSTVNHYFAHSTASLGVIFCTYSIYQKLTHRHEGVENVKRQRKLFRMLLIQCIIPLICFEAPASLYITFPLWAPDNTFGYTAPIMTILLSMPKLLDPIVLLVFIAEYRHAVFRMITGKGNTTDPITMSKDSRGTG